MTPEAKRWAVRTLLEADRSLPRNRSLRELDEAIAALDALSSVRARLIRSYRAGGRWADPKVCQELERTLQWLAGRITEPIVMPHEDVPDDEPVDDDGLIDPEARAALAPLVEIRPSKSEPLKLHAKSTERPFSGRRSTGETRAMAEAFPEAHDDGTGDSRDGVRLWGNRGAAIQAAGSTGAPMGRPRRGSTVPETAEQLLLAGCPGYSIEQLRRVATARGKPSAEVLSARAVLESAVTALRARQSVTSGALAGVLGCSVRTIHRLRDAGEQRAA